MQAGYKMTALIAVLYALALSHLLTVSKAQDGSPLVPVSPSYTAYKSSLLENTVTDSCMPYPSDTPVPQGVTPTEFVQCSQPTTITDNNVGPPFYVAAESPGQILFVFPRAVNLSSITISYQFNITYALAKLRLYAVPDDFDAWDSINSFSGQSEPIDEITFTTGQEEGIRDMSITDLQWVTSRVLLRKLEDTKDYLFAMSEVRFQEFIPPETVTTATTVGTPTVAMTTLTSTNGTAAPSNATDANTDPSPDTPDTITIPGGSGQLATTGSLLLTILMALITLHGLLR